MQMIKQKYANGYWIGRTINVCPKCISFYHLVPFAFLIAIFATSIFACFGIWYLSVFMWGLYGLFALANTVFSAIKNGLYVQTVLMPVLFLILHVAYGAGTFVGILKSI